MIRLLPALFAALLLGAVARGDGPIAIDPPQRTAPVQFEAEILPILRASCIACHNERTAESGLRLDTPEGILKGGEQGPAVVAGKSGESLLLKLAAHQAESFMPPPENEVGAKPLAPRELGLIKLWIDQGATGGVAAKREIRWRPLPTAHQPILAVAVTSDGQYAAASRGNRLLVYHVPSAKLVAELSDVQLQSATPIAHHDVVRSLAFDPSGDRLASGGFREVKLWQRPRPKVSSHWPHETAVVSVAAGSAAGSDSRLAATGDEAGRIHIWDVSSGETRQTFAAHEGPIVGLAFSADGDQLYSASPDKTLRCWSVSEGKALGEPLAWEQEWRSIALINESKWLVAGDAEGKITVWDAAALRTGESQEPVREIKAHEGAVTAIIAWASEPLQFAAAGEDGLIRRYSAESGETLSQWRHESPVTSLAVSADGQKIASAGGGIAKLWNIADGEVIATLQRDPALAAKVAKLESEIAFSKSFITNLQNDNKSYEGSERRVTTTAEAVKQAEEEVTKAEKARDEKQEAVDKAGEGAEKDDEKKREAARKELADTETAVQVAMSNVDRAKAVAQRAVKTHEEEKQAVAAREEVLKRQESEKEAASKELNDTRPPFRSVAFSADGHWLAIGDDAGALHFAHASTGVLVETLSPHQGAITAMCFTSSGELIAGASDKQASVIDAPSQWKQERTIGSVDQPDILVDRVQSVAFSADGAQLVTAGGRPSFSGEVKIWNVDDGALLREFSDLHSDSVFAAAFSPDGQYLATAGADRFVKVTSLAGDTPPRTLAGHTAHVLALSWRADGKQLVSCGSDQVLKLWDVQLGTPVHTMKGTTYQIGRYKGEVTAASFVGESDLIVAASGDGTVRLQRASSENDVFTFADSKGYQYAVAATPDGQTVLAGGSDGVLRRWSVFERGIKHAFEAAE
jgi:WD40 repeat protein